MNILIFNWRDPKNPKSGGAEIVTLEHAKQWVTEGNNVTWFTSSFKGAKNAEVLDGVEMIRKGNFLSVFLLAPFFYLFSKRKWDIVIDEIHGIPFFTPLFVRVPKIVFIHEVAKEIWDYMYPFPISVIGKFLETCYFSIYQSLPFWTDASSTIDELVVLGIQRKNCIAIPCPITNSVVTHIPKKEKEKTFIFVSRVVKMKGIEEVIKAFGFIHQEDDKAKLWIVGRGEKSYIQKLQYMVRDYGIEKNVTFWGGVSEKEKLSLMEKAHVLLHASVKEGWGLVVLEAASQGTPAVVYNVAGLRDSVKNTITGIVLHENSPKEMARQALLLVENKREYKRFQDNGFAFVKSLTWESVTAQSLELLERVRRNG